MMLPEENKRDGVISASLGNHAQALCYHGRRLNIPVTVVMPMVAPIIKIEACRNFGATVIVQGNNMRESKHLALQLSKERNIVYINGYGTPAFRACACVCVWVSGLGGFLIFSRHLPTYILKSRSDYVRGK